MTLQPNSRFNRHQSGAFAVFLMYAGLAALYILIGAAVLIFQQYWRDFQIELKIAFGVLCLVYGCFRLYRAYRNYREKLDEIKN